MRNRRPSSTLEQDSRYPASPSPKQPSKRVNFGDFSQFQKLKGNVCLEVQSYSRRMKP